MISRNNASKKMLSDMEILEKSKIVDSSELMTDQEIVNYIQKDLKNSKYVKLRNFTEQAKESNLEIELLKALLENIEMNYSKSEQIYSSCLEKYADKEKTLYYLASLQIQKGEYEIARAIYETLAFDSKYYVKATYGIVYTFIYERDFKTAYDYLNKINTNALNDKQIHDHKNIYMYIQKELGILKNIKSLDKHDDYFIYQHIFNSDKTLENHIKSHCNQLDKYSTSCFYKEIDLKKLIADAKREIEDINPNKYEISDVYRMKLDNSIGYSEGISTKDLAVVTIAGTKNIITMYPIQLSEHFDSENLLHDKTLKAKRVKGIRY